ncbi:hypothetical protein J6590_099437, partial [Homalodisca vitripennis]
RYKLDWQVFISVVAPAVLKAHGIAKGKSLTSYPSVKEELVSDYKYSEDKVVIDGIVKKIKPMTRRAFAKEICVELTTPHIQGRQKLPNLSRNLKRNIEDVVGPSTSEAQSVIEEAGTRKICAVCPAKKRRMTRFQCTKCYKHICLEHRGMLCVKCSNKD